MNNETKQTTETKFILITVCKDGFYNGSCMDKCGNCQEGEPCDKQTGKCTNGCQPHFQSPFCKGAIMKKQKYSITECIIYCGILIVRGGSFFMDFVGNFLTTS